MTWFKRRIIKYHNQKFFCHIITSSCSKAIDMNDIWQRSADFWPTAIYYCLLIMKPCFYSTAPAVPTHQPLPAITLWSQLSVQSRRRESILFLSARVHRNTAQLSTRVCEQQWMCLNTGVHQPEVSGPLPGHLRRQRWVPSRQSLAAVCLCGWLHWRRLQTMLSAAR